MIRLQTLFTSYATHLDFYAVNFYCAYHEIHPNGSTLARWKHTLKTHI